MNSSKLKFASTALITYSGMGLSLVSAPLMARALGAEGRGDLAASFAALQTVEFVVFLGLPRGMALARSEGLGVSRRGIFLTACLGLIATLGLLIAAEFIAENDRVLWGARWAALAVAMVGVAQFGGQVLLIDGHMGRFNLYRSFPLILPSLIIIIAYFLGHLTFEVAYWATLGSAVLSNCVGIWFAIPAIRSAERVRTPWRASITYWSAIAMDSIGRRLDLLFAAAFLSSAANGVYVVAATLALAAGAMSQALNLTSFSRFVRNRSANQSNGLGRKHTSLLLGVSTISASAVAGATFVLAIPLFGPDFESLGPVAAVLCFSQVAKDWFSWLIDTMTTQGGGSRVTCASVTGLVTLVFAIALLVSREELTSLTLALAVAAFSTSRLVVVSWGFRRR